MSDHAGNISASEAASIKSKARHRLAMKGFKSHGLPYQTHTDHDE